MVSRVAERGEGQGVGRQITSVVLPADFNLEPIPRYHTSMPSHAVHYPSYVVAMNDQRNLAIMDGVFEAVEPSSTRPLAVQKVGRNAPCPCNSGMKYKQCHGRYGSGVGGLSVVWE